jgi:hypothetical protein
MPLFMDVHETLPDPGDTDTHGRGTGPAETIEEPNRKETMSEPFV